MVEETIRTIRETEKKADQIVEEAGRQGRGSRQAGRKTAGRS